MAVWLDGRRLLAVALFALFVAGCQTFSPDEDFLDSSVRKEIARGSAPEAETGFATEREPEETEGVPVVTVTIEPVAQLPPARPFILPNQPAVKTPVPAKPRANLDSLLTEPLSPRALRERLAQRSQQEPEAVALTLRSWLREAAQN